MSGEITPEFIALVGMKRSGKSTFAAKIAQSESGNVLLFKHISNINDKAFAFLPEKTYSNWRQGAAPTQPVKFKMAGVTKKDYQKLIDWVYEGNFKNGTLILDDTVVFERYKTSDTFLNLITLCRHYQLNIVIIYHSLRQIPIDNFDNLNKLVLFYTTASFKSRQHEFTNYDELVAAHNQVTRNRQNAATFYKPVILNMEVG